MGNVRSYLFLVLAACGSNGSNKPDAAVVHDAPVDSRAIDAKDFLDAAQPRYDFSCFGVSPPTSAPDPISISGTTEEVTTSGLSAVDAVPVSVYKAGGGASAVGTATSAADGSFTISGLVTGGVPFDGHLQAPKATYRTTYLFPGHPLAADLTGAPVVMFSDQTFMLLTGTLLGVTQDDTANGVVFALLTDCAFQPISGGQVAVQQGGADVGTLVSLEASLGAMAAGAFIALNVPDGPTEVSGRYGSMTFPAHTVGVHKKPGGQNAEGTVTVTQVRPGP
jgi:hypothetical protein